MSYLVISQITQSGSLQNRLTAAAAQEHKPTPYGAWVYDHIWDFASQPGWAEAWASALAGGVTDPGSNESVITDGMILSAVQSIVDPVPIDEEV